MSNPVVQALQLTALYMDGRYADVFATLAAYRKAELLDIAAALLNVCETYSAVDPLVQQAVACLTAVAAHGVMVSAFAQNRDQYMLLAEWAEANR